MTKLQNLGLALVGLWFIACGGSQKAAEAAPAPSSDAAPAASADANSPKSDTASQPAEAKAEPEPASTGPECKKKDDCTIFSDCCTCKAVPASKPSPTPCESVCGESKCEVKGMTIDNVACENERCVLKKK